MLILANPCCLFRPKPQLLPRVLSQATVESSKGLGIVADTHESQCLEMLAGPHDLAGQDHLASLQL